VHCTDCLFLSSLPQLSFLFLIMLPFTVNKDVYNMSKSGFVEEMGHFGLHIMFNGYVYRQHIHGVP